MNEAIKLAIEKGWQDTHQPYRNNSEANALAVLDPLFWQALGKALRWTRVMATHEELMPEWKVHWHRFIDHIAEGKDADDFFNALLAERRAA